ncbi:ABC transporter ATP-binding protein [Lachnoclostridium phytofermentans]|uniref:ABC transporter related n=1 Tax=Lachnoclostridium phytofermentans (strain ATCC 700394 / DSM 18823 / ISDg) TaxID=357809 RepID=A9KHR0_LACP7|nr:ABC transporter ATP-binding protein [Lachnoclostridium phytofermentans]ABX42345.1 ABC transporter related [Lachnoclostridium phytofermentans ISDg]
MSILELKNVCYKYEGTSKNVLSNINLSFEQGNLYAIMGKSGSGKTTLLSIISGLDLATSGEVLWNGKSLKEINRDDYRAKGIGVIFQGYNLLTNATVLENIILSMNISESKEKNKKQFALDILSRVSIDEEKANRKTLKLSGGEQQRVGIARALSHDPDIIIADEPTGNLDTDTEESIMEILKDLAHNQNKCVIVVTHSKNVATYADEVLGLSHGNLVNDK